ncbi:MAG: GMC family oxidoreductase [Ideonella sp. MAG2]|nr:MAG: GMC family oxidoreductase [Ideonella sp. MAG2]
MAEAQTLTHHAVPAAQRAGVPDPIQAGLARGWKVKGGPHGSLPPSLSCDVLIVGTGAGGGITAEILARAGLSVVLVEEGPLKSSSDFKQLESEAYPTLYQESAGRKTADKAINILQGRCVGGSTTVNWTSSFRTPPETLKHWVERFDLQGFDAAAMAPWFEQAEKRLNIGDWLTPPNENNELLRRGAQKLGIEASAIRRNVRGCWNLGSCGMGCPTNAKQSMLVTTVPTALDAGATLLVQTRAERLVLAGDRVESVLCFSLKPDGTPDTAAACRVVAKHVVVAGGAINSPALLLRSSVPDPHQRLGRRTFLHPVVMSAGVFEHKVEAWQGAPQTLYSDHFLHTQAIDGPMGYKLEAPPLHPLIFSSTLAGFGQAQADVLGRFPHIHTLLALLRDGFHERSPGGEVQLRGDGSPELHYPLNDFVMEGARRALLSMVEIQFAAGATEVQVIHEQSPVLRSWAQARTVIEGLPMVPLKTRVVSAHVMGGCGLSGTEVGGVTRPDGGHWQVRNLSVHDGSLFPTSVGANPQLSIYGLVARLATGLAQRLGGRPVRLDA